jgi:hypothetical protein
MAGEGGWCRCMGGGGGTAGDGVFEKEEGASISAGVERPCRLDERGVDALKRV